MRLKKSDENTQMLEMSGHETHSQMLGIFATDEWDFANRLMSDLVNAGGGSKTPTEADYNELLSLVHGIAPRDGVEAMLAVQMAAAHVAVVRSARHLRGSESTVQSDSNGNLLNKLMRTFTTQVETLNRYRNAGQQQVVVKHVQVNAGQAVVGITMTEGGGSVDGN